MVTATFHTPTYTPPCERCTHHGDLGDTGGWIITGLGCTAEATAHTPSAVIGAFTHALPGGDTPGEVAGVPAKKKQRPGTDILTTPSPAVPRVTLTVSR